MKGKGWSKETRMEDISRTRTSRRRRRVRLGRKMIRKDDETRND